MKTCFAVLVIAICLCCFSQVRAQDVAAGHLIDVIDPSIRYQTMDYFTASDAWTMQNIGSWSDENRQKVADLLFSRDKGIGLSAWRFNLYGGIEKTRISIPNRTGETFELAQGKYDWTRCSNQRWFLAAAKSRGVKTFVAFCNSPPARLTRNGLTCTDVNPSISNNLKPGMEQQYGTYLADILLHFKNNADQTQRVNFDWISPINEPQWEWVGGQEGSRASNEDILRQYKATYAELKKHQLSTHILGPESGNVINMYQPAGGTSKKYHSPFGNYIELFCSDRASAEMMNHTLAYHSYWSDDFAQMVDYRKQFRARLDAHPDWRAAESEYCIMEPHRDLTMKAAIHAMRVLHTDLTIVNSTTWSWWLAVSLGHYKDGLIYSDWKKAGDAENILPSKLCWALGNFSRFIRPGMVRIGLKSTEAPHGLTTVMASAYQDPTTGQTVAVYINAGADPVTLNLQFAKSQTGRWQRYITSDLPGDDLKQYPAIEFDQPISLPGRSVSTLVSSR